MPRNEIERLRDMLRERFPDAELAIDPPAMETGNWFLDATVQGHLVVVEWRPDRGFGISTPSVDDYGTGPDEVYGTLDSAYERTKALLLSQTRSRPSRKARRSDVLIGTLRNAVAAMGGELYLVAKFPDETVYIDLESVETRNGAKETTT